jgi:hypothetical protein
MTDTRLPSEWLLGRLVRLKPSAFRSYVCALMWSVANRTDGRIESADLAYIPGFDAADIPELIGSDLWALRVSRGQSGGQSPGQSAGNWWLIVDFRATQTSRSEHESLERARAKDRERKAKKRAEAKALSGRQSGGQSGGQNGGPHRQEGRQAGRQFSYVPGGDK